MSQFNKHLLIRLSYLLPVFFYGCAHVPKQELTAHLDTNSTLSHIPSDSSDLFTKEWPKEKWWEDFEDPQLNTLIETALKDSPNLQQLESRLHRAIQVAKMQRSSLFPSLQANFETDWMYFGQNSFYRVVAPTLNSTYTELQLGLSFSYEFDFWGKNRNLLTSALGYAKATEADVAQTTLMLTTGVAFAYFERQFYDEQSAILEEIHAEKNKLLELLKLRNTYSIDSLTPSLFAKESIEDIKARLAISKEKVEINTHLLKALAGMGQDASLDFKKIPLQRCSYYLPESLHLDLLSRRPDLLAQLWKVEAHAHLINAAKADFYPNVDLNATGGFQSLNLGQLLSGKSLVGTLAPAIHLPIFTGGKLTARLKESTAAFEEAVFAYNNLVQTAAKEVVDELSSLQSLISQMEARETAFKLAEERYTLSKLRFENKIESYIQPLQNLEAVLEQKIALTNLKYAASLQAVKLIKVLGGGYYMPHKPSETVQRYQND